MIQKVNNHIKSASDATLGWFIFGLALVLRAAYAIFAYSQNVMANFADDNLYFEIGKKVAGQGQIFYETADWRYDIIGPFLPWVNGLTIGVFGDSWLPVFLVTAVVSAAISLLIYRTTLFIAGRKPALLAGLWSVFYVFYLRYVPTAGKDLWMAFLLLIIVYYLIKTYNERLGKMRKTIFMTIVFAASMHLDERFIVFGPLILFYLIYMEIISHKTKRWRIPGTFVLLSILLLIPWNLRNYKKFEKPVILTTRTERITDKILGIEHKKRPFEWLYDSANIYQIKPDHYDSIVSGLKTHTDGGYRISPKQRKAMAKGHLPEQMSTLESVWMRLKILLRPFQWGGEYQKKGFFYVEYSSRHNWASFLFYGLMLFASFPGFWWLFRKKREAFYLLAGVIGVYVLAHALAVPWTTERYRLPIAAFFIIAGGIGMGWLLEQIKWRISKN
ncbi:hypothetical protein L21SP5_02131 [Salinivirga cyanobacteriivorans]|uniref:Glycosyltransferase RgtA/B/C/D-like domain-containing protein n=1 Tax=Salinivirga cyanobacteriivorans TaxID=1307839 RepID=A0A0S2I0C3_9BACT|nr:glycosyltransferase family 39 protein [Salinivirga cyanobacteriivorans]ALO15764.1 hypothetical protein L21SP5_02131 [Salinivirga cyanobacteriivorans]